MPYGRRKPANFRRRTKAPPSYKRSLFTGDRKKALDKVVKKQQGQNPRPQPNNNLKPHASL